MADEQKPHRKQEPDNPWVWLVAQFETLEPYAGVRLAIIAATVAVLLTYYNFRQHLLGWYSTPELVLRFGGLLPPLVWAGEWWRLITFLFLPSNLSLACVHIVAQIFLASRLEPVIGPWRLAWLYLGSGICGGIAAVNFDSGIIVGGELPTFGLAAAVACFRPPQGVSEKDRQFDFRIWVWLSLASTLLLLVGHRNPLAWATPQPPVKLTEGGITVFLPTASFCALAGATAWGGLLGIAWRIFFHPLSCTPPFVGLAPGLLASIFAIGGLVTAHTGRFNAWRCGYDWYTACNQAQDDKALLATWQTTFLNSQDQVWRLRWLADKALERAWWHQAEDCLQQAAAVMDQKTASLTAAVAPFGVSGYFWSWCQGRDDDNYLEFQLSQGMDLRMGIWWDLLEVYKIQGVNGTRQAKALTQVEAAAHALSTSEGAAIAENLLAYCYAQQGVKLDEALRLADSACASASSAAFLDTLAWAHFARGEYHQAQEVINLVNETPPLFNPEIEYHRAAILAMLKDGKQAYKLARQVLNLGGPWWVLRGARLLEAQLAPSAIEAEAEPAAAGKTSQP